MATDVQLGDFVFEHAEVPEKLNFGGSQDISMKKIIGGKRQVQALGRSDDIISWDGIFFGDAAFDRAKYLDSLRVAANVLSFTFFDKHFLVIIQDFRPQLEAEWQIPYSISLMIVDDASLPTTVIKKDSYIDKIWADLIVALDIAERVRYPNIGGFLAQAAGYLEAFLPGTAITSQFSNELRDIFKKVLGEVQNAIKNELGKGL